MAIFVKLNESDVKSRRYAGATQYSDIGWGFEKHYGLKDLSSFTTKDTQSKWGWRGTFFTFTVLTIVKAVCVERCLIFRSGRLPFESTMIFQKILNDGNNSFCCIFKNIMARIFECFYFRIRETALPLQKIIHIKHKIVFTP